MIRCMQNMPVIILVEPQLVENIGMAARAMMNCGLAELRIVNPRDAWPLGDIHRQRMAAASAGADAVLDHAQLFPTLEDAIADLQYVYATTARSPGLVNRILTARSAAADMVVRLAGDQKIGVLFGRERTGLTLDQVALAHVRVTIPLNPDFTSLNLAQAVLLVGYEWFQARDATPDKRMHVGASRPATAEEYQNFFRRLEAELDTSGFFVAPDMRPGMVLSLQSMLLRAEMTEQEIRTWHGVVSALAGIPKRRVS